jgi:hypothetical protein
VRRAAAIPAAIVLALAIPAGACPDDTIRAKLAREAVRAHRWDLGWGLTFGVAAAGYTAMAASDWEFGASLNQAQRDDLWLGAIKAGIASLSHVVLPLRIEEPGGDTCADDAAAIHALEVSARHEAMTFWLSIAGGIALNGGSLLYLGVHDHDWKQGAISAGVGTVPAIFHTWTAPRGARRALDQVQLSAAITPRFTGLVISGSF